MTGASMTRTYGLMTPFDTKMQDGRWNMLILTGPLCFHRIVFCESELVGLISSYMHHTYHQIGNVIMRDIALYMFVCVHRSISTYASQL